MLSYHGHEVLELSDDHLSDMLLIDVRDKESQGVDILRDEVSQCRTLRGLVKHE